MSCQKCWNKFQCGHSTVTGPLVISATSTSHQLLKTYAIIHITHPFNGPFSGTTQVSQYQTGKINLDFTEARDSEWQWHQLGSVQVCTSLQTENHASTPPLSFSHALPAAPKQCQSTEGVEVAKMTKGPVTVEWPHWNYFNINTYHTWSKLQILHDVQVTYSQIKPLFIIFTLHISVPSVFWHCWLGFTKSIRPLKIEWCGAGVVICLEWDADYLHMVQLMPLHP